MQQSFNKSNCGFASTSVRKDQQRKVYHIEKNKYVARNRADLQVAKEKQVHATFRIIL